MNRNDNKFHEGQLVVWDSGFGYDLGEFVRVSDENLYNTYEVKLITGKYQGVSYFSKHQVQPFTEALEKKLIKKYQY